jgi:hypothetical protein
MARQVVVLLALRQAWAALPRVPLADAGRE